MVSYISAVSHLLLCIDEKGKATYVVDGDFVPMRGNSFKPYITHVTFVFCTYP